MESPARHPNGSVDMLSFGSISGQGVRKNGAVPLKRLDGFLGIFVRVCDLPLLYDPLLYQSVEIPAHRGPPV